MDGPDHDVSLIYNINIILISITICAICIPHLYIFVQLTVLEEAIKHIDSLHMALSIRFFHPDSNTILPSTISEEINSGMLIQTLSSQLVTDHTLKVTNHASSEITIQTLLEVTNQSSPRAKVTSQASHKIINTMSPNVLKQASPNITK